VRRGYVSQAALQIIRAEARNAYNLSGSGIVAVIDTGVDPNHPALRSSLLPGYDLTRNLNGTASEMGDVSQSTAAVVDGVPPTYVNKDTAAIVDQSTAAVVDQPGTQAFGHGTMVAGVIHLVAPGAMILPIKAFHANGSGYTSDILRAVYRAVRDGARVINMSFSMQSEPIELRRSIDHAISKGVICVASAGNQGLPATVYPAAWDNVMGVASTNNSDQRSWFSNYGQSLVWVAAPGEGVITTYPYGTYAAAWGTSFSTPFVAGTAALLLQARANLSQPGAAGAIGQAHPLGPELGRGRLDILSAIQAAVAAQ
jgi:thermitase